MTDVLLIEDNSGDVRLMKEALAGSDLRIHVAEDGDEALQFLRQKGRFSLAPRPDLIFLDLNLPRRDGREVLEEIKKDAELRRIPVIILTTSDAQQDVQRAYDLHANCYVRKPSELDDFFDVIRSCQDFWLSTVQLPVR